MTDVVSVWGKLPLAARRDVFVVARPFIMSPFLFECHPPFYKENLRIRSYMIYATTVHKGARDVLAEDGGIMQVIRTLLMFLDAFEALLANDSSGTEIRAAQKAFQTMMDKPIDHIFYSEFTGQWRFVLGAVERLWRRCDPRLSKLIGCAFMDVMTLIDDYCRDPGKSECAVFKKLNEERFVKGQHAFELNDMAKKIFVSGQLDDAYEVYTQALAHAPFQWKLYNNRSLMARNIGKHQMAVLDAMRAVVLQPRQSRCQERFVRALFAVGRRQDSETAYGYARDRCDFADFQRDLSPLGLELQFALPARSAWAGPEELSTAGDRGAFVQDDSEDEPEEDDYGDESNDDDYTDDDNDDDYDDEDEDDDEFDDMPALVSSDDEDDDDVSFPPKAATSRAPQPKKQPKAPAQQKAKPPPQQQPSAFSSSASSSTPAPSSKPQASKKAQPSSASQPTRAKHQPKPKPRPITLTNMARARSLLADASRQFVKKDSLNTTHLINEALALCETNNGDVPMLGRQHHYEVQKAKYLLARACLASRKFQMAEDLFKELCRMQDPFRPIQLLARYGRTVIFLTYRQFPEALETLLQLQDDVAVEPFETSVCWPYTDQAIDLTAPGALQSEVEKDVARCRNPPTPDGICRYRGCEDPNIYLKTPMSSGLVRVCCDDRVSCTVTYHPACWKLVKQEIRKDSEQELTDSPTRCLTPDCPGEVSSVLILDKAAQNKLKVQRTSAREDEKRARAKQVRAAVAEQRKKARHEQKKAAFEVRIRRRRQEIEQLRREQEEKQRLEQEREAQKRIEALRKKREAEERQRRETQEREMRELEKREAERIQEQLRQQEQQAEALRKERLAHEAAEKQRKEQKQQQQQQQQQQQDEEVEAAVGVTAAGLRTAQTEAQAAQTYQQNPQQQPSPVQQPTQQPLQPQKQQSVPQAVPAQQRQPAAQPEREIKRTEINSETKVDKINDGSEPKPEPARAQEVTKQQVPANGGSGSVDLRASATSFSGPNAGSSEVAQVSWDYVDRAVQAAKVQARAEVEAEMASRVKEYQFALDAIKRKLQNAEEQLTAERAKSDTLAVLREEALKQQATLRQEHYRLQQSSNHSGETLSRLRDSLTQAQQQRDTEKRRADALEESNRMQTAMAESMSAELDRTKAELKILKQSANEVSSLAEAQDMLVQQCEEIKQQERVFDATRKTWSLEKGRLEANYNVLMKQFENLRTQTQTVLAQEKDGVLELLEHTRLVEEKRFDTVAAQIKQALSQARRAYKRGSAELYDAQKLADDRQKSLAAERKAHADRFTLLAHYAQQLTERKAAQLLMAPPAAAAPDLSAIRPADPKLHFRKIMSSLKALYPDETWESLIEALQEFRSNCPQQSLANKAPADIIMGTAMALFEKREEKRIREEVEAKETVPEDVCSICLDHYNTKEPLRLECDHWFHVDCLQDWLGQQRTCPICRAPILLEFPSLSA